MRLSFTNCLLRTEIFNSAKLSPATEAVIIEHQKSLLVSDKIKKSSFSCLHDFACSACAGHIVQSLVMVSILWSAQSIRTPPGRLAVLAAATGLNYSRPDANPDRRPDLCGRTPRVGRQRH